MASEAYRTAKTRCQLTNYSMSPELKILNPDVYFFRYVHASATDGTHVEYADADSEGRVTVDIKSLVPELLVEIWSNSSEEFVLEICGFTYKSSNNNDGDNSNHSAKGFYHSGYPAFLCENATLRLTAKPGTVFTFHCGAVADACITTLRDFKGVRLFKNRVVYDGVVMDTKRETSYVLRKSLRDIDRQLTTLYNQRMAILQTMETANVSWRAPLTLPNCPENLRKYFPEQYPKVEEEEAAEPEAKAAPEPLFAKPPTPPFNAADLFSSKAGAGAGTAGMIAGLLAGIVGAVAAGAAKKKKQPAAIFMEGPAIQRTDKTFGAKPSATMGTAAHLFSNAGAGNPFATLFSAELKGTPPTAEQEASAALEPEPEPVPAPKPAPKAAPTAFDGAELMKLLTMLSR